MTTPGDSFGDQLQKFADKVRKQIESLPKETTFGEMFTPDFMQRHTHHESIQAFFDASPWKLESEDDLAAIPLPEWDEHVRQHSSFASWEEMGNAAAAEWAKRKLGR